MKFIYIICSLLIFFLFTFFVLYPKSLNNEELLIPDYLYLKKDDVIDKLDKNFIVKYQYIESEKEKNTILDIYPKPNTIVKNKSNIILYLSSGSINTKMIKVVNRYYEDIIDDILDLKNNLNFNIYIEYEKTKIYPDGYIIYQYPNESEVINDKVILRLSKNESYIYIPDFRLMEEALFIDFCKKNNLKYIIEYEQTMDFLDNIIIYQSYFSDYYFIDSEYEIKIIVLKNHTDN